MRSLGRFHTIPRVAPSPLLGHCPVGLDGGEALICEWSGESPILLKELLRLCYRSSVPEEHRLLKVIREAINGTVGAANDVQSFIEQPGLGMLAREAGCSRFPGADRRTLFNQIADSHVLGNTRGSLHLIVVQDEPNVHHGSCFVCVTKPAHYCLNKLWMIQAVLVAKKANSALPSAG